MFWEGTGPECRQEAGSACWEGVGPVWSCFGGAGCTLTCLPHLPRLRNPSSCRGARLLSQGEPTQAFRKWEGQGDPSRETHVRSGGSPGVQSPGNRGCGLWMSLAHNWKQSRRDCELRLDCRARQRAKALECLLEGEGAMGPRCGEERARHSHVAPIDCERQPASEGSLDSSADQQMGTGGGVGDRMTPDIEAGPKQRTP